MKEVPWDAEGSGGACEAGDPCDPEAYCLRVLTCGEEGCAQCVEPPDRIAICHRPPGNPANERTLDLPLRAALAHLAEHAGDEVGACGRSIPPEENRNACGGCAELGHVLGLDHPSDDRPQRVFSVMREFGTIGAAAFVGDLLPYDLFCADLIRRDPGYRGQVPQTLFRTSDASDWFIDGALPLGETRVSVVAGWGSDQLVYIDQATDRQRLGYSLSPTVRRVFDDPAPSSGVAALDTFLAYLEPPDPRANSDPTWEGASTWTDYYDNPVRALPTSSPVDAGFFFPLQVCGARDPSGEFNVCDADASVEPVFSMSPPSLAIAGAITSDPIPVLAWREQRHPFTSIRCREGRDHEHCERDDDQVMLALGSAVFEDVATFPWVFIVPAEVRLFPDGPSALVRSNVAVACQANARYCVLAYLRREDDLSDTLVARRFHIRVGQTGFEANFEQTEAEGIVRVDGVDVVASGDVGLMLVGSLGDADRSYYLIVRSHRSSLPIDIYRRPSTFETEWTLDASVNIETLRTPLPAPFSETARFNFVRE